MVHLPLAFSVHHFISSVGADAGFASIIGLAILVLLYFAQARETSTLRNRADEAEQRAAQLEARVAQVARAQSQAPLQPPGPRPAPSPIARPLANLTGAAVSAPATAPEAAVARAAALTTAVPSAPAGVGAPALSAATRLIPVPAVAVVSSEATAVASGPAPAPAPATVAGGAGATAVVPAADPLTGENGVGHDTGESGPLPFAAAEPPLEPLPRVQLRPGGAQSRPAPPPLRRASAPKSPSRFGRGIALLLTVLGIGVVVAVLLIATSGGGKPAPTASTKTTNALSPHHRSKPKGFDKGAVTVTVLNGTATAGLAETTLTKLTNDGYKQGTATNAASQTQTSTIVSYLPGQRTAALAIAHSLKLLASAVSPIGAATQAIACPQSAACTVDVVVTVGQDLASQ